ncbi:MAG TPA: hypothetical protein VEL74_24155 [Thermoanaerobaculia bacterium]|nr:hypothetical protein [Thermoanaerobaculia bacterium]
MSNASSYADFITEMEGLLAAVTEHAAELPSVETHRAALAAFAEELKALKLRQDTARAVRQRSTQELKAFKAKGRGLIIRLQGAVKADLGHDNEKLVQFGVAPFRKRVRRTGPFAIKPKAPAQPILTAPAPNAPSGSEEPTT